MEDSNGTNLQINDNDESQFDLNNSIFIDNKENPEVIRNKCRELVRLPNEPKYRDFIENLLKESNQKFCNK